VEELRYNHVLVCLAIVLHFYVEMTHQFRFNAVSDYHFKTDPQLSKRRFAGILSTNAMARVDTLEMTYGALVRRSKRIVTR